MATHAVITTAHWIGLVGVFAVVLAMASRANLVVPSIVAPFAVSLASIHSPLDALLNDLKALRSDIRLAQPGNEARLGSENTFDKAGLVASTPFAMFYRG